MFRRSDSVCSVSILGVVCTIAVSISACGPPTPGPIVQRLVDEYAPGLPIGERLPEATRARYKLALAAYAGYADETYEGPDGVRHLVILMSPSPDEGVDEQLSPSARISGVRLYARTPAVVARVESRIRALMGAPTVRCYTAGSGERVETRFWPGDRGGGVLLLLSPASSANKRWTEPGGAEVTFGAAPVSPEHVTFEPCT